MGRRGKKMADTANVWKINKINWASSIQPTFFKRGEYNLLLSTNNVQINKLFFANPSRWRQNPW